MTDTEAVILCSTVMGLELMWIQPNAPEHTLRLVGSVGVSYWPITNDDQMLNMLRALSIEIERSNNRGWKATINRTHESHWEETLNKAVVHCVAQMKLAELNAPLKDL